MSQPPSSMPEGAIRDLNDYGDGTGLTSESDANIIGAAPCTTSGKSWNANIQPGGSVQLGLQGIKVLRIREYQR